MTDSAADFYDNLADGYDAMTRFDKRLAAQEPAVVQLIERFDVRKAIDVATGTGLFAVLLARHGVETVATDISADMLRQAEENAVARGLSVTFHQAPMQEPIPAKGADLLVCLGNSIPHLRTDEDLAEALSSFHQALRPGGTVLIQSLNYEKVLREKQRFINATRDGDTEFIRFYDFHDDQLVFNLMRVEWKDDVAQEALSSTVLRPLTRDQFTPALEAAGFSDLSYCADLLLREFIPGNSPNLVVCASRS